jgi:nucleoside-diphosphate-sugar epimerase
MKHYLVTGCAGFIGAKVAELLLRQGHRVAGIDNMNAYYDRRLKNHRLAALKAYPRFSFKRIDIEKLPALERIFRGKHFDAVINLAARAGVRYSMENPHVYFSTNTQGTLNLLELCRRHKIFKFVLASTSSLYAGQKMPFTENLPVNTPISPYAASKKGAEVACYTYHYLYGIDVTILRYFTVYGPAGRPDMSIFRFIKWIDEGHTLELFGDGSQSRDFTYIDDIAAGTVKAIKRVGFEIINLGGGRRPKDLRQVIAQIESALGKKARIKQRPFHKTDMRATSADITKAKRLLGWSPKTDLTAGLAKTLDWYVKNRSWLVNITL